MVLTRLSPPTPVAAEVVHAVVDALFEGGCRDVTIGAALASRDRDRGHRSVSALAHQAGLTGCTPRGRNFTVVDLGDDLVAAPVPESGVLSEQSVSKRWVEADLRVVVGRAVTDLVETFAGCLATLLGAAPEMAGVEPADVLTDLMRYLPPHLAVIDALVLSEGPDGGRLLSPVETDSLILTSDALLADTTLASLIGVDRSSSRLVERLVASLGPPGGRVVGSTTPWPGVTRPQPLAVASARRVATDVRLARVLSATTGGPDEGAGSADSMLTRLRTIVTPAVQAAADPVAQASLVGLLAAVSLGIDAGDAWGVGFDKNRVDRRAVPLGFDASSHCDAEYDAIPVAFAPFDTIIDALPAAEPNALRWCLVDGATVFEVTREVAADFDEFVARVDVAQGISLMADYLGGRRIIVGRSVLGATTEDPEPPVTIRQAERNIYLPQPNYLAAVGGQPIDVCKIELVEVGRDRHRLSWRTVDSPNGSAAHDDGSLVVARTGSTTTVTIRGRQQFTLPTAWAGFDPTIVPELYGPLLEDAYRRFFTATFDNLEACFEGRDFRIGRPPPEPDEPLLTESLALLLDVAGDWIREHTAAPHRAERERPHDPPEIDLDGFQHTSGPRGARTASPTTSAP